MKRLWAGKDQLRLAMLRSELDAKHIRYSVRNEDLQVAAGELPVLDTWPEIWIHDAERFHEAQEILADLGHSDGKT